MARIGILHGFNYGNKGDVAIVKSTISRLREAIPDVSITVYSHFEEELRSSIPGAKTIPALISAEVYKTFRNRKLHLGNMACQILGIIATMVYMFAYTIWGMTYRLAGERSYHLVSEKKRSVLRAYADADLIISRGGGFLTDTDIICVGQGKFVTEAVLEWTFLFHMYSIFFALLLRKPVVIYAQSVGPFKRPLNAIIAKIVLNRVMLITVREPKSKLILRNIGVISPPTYVTADEAFCLEEVNKKRAREILIEHGIDPENRPIAGINVRRWPIPFSSNPDEDYHRYGKTIVSAIEHLIREYGATIVLIPQGFSTAVEREIRSSVRTPERLIVLNPCSPEEIKGVIGEMDLFIGTHMHSSIFSLSMCIPTIIISYAHLHKTAGIMDMMSVGKWVISIDNLSPMKLISRIDNLMECGKEVRNDIAINLERMKRKAKLNADLVMQHLNLIRSNADGKC